MAVSVVQLSTGQKFYNFLSNEKGLYFSPRYEVITDNDPYGSFVTKKDFNQYEFGDTVKGYSTDDYSFFTTLDFIYDSFILLPLTGAFLFAFIFYLSRFRKDEKEQEGRHHRHYNIVHSVCYRLCQALFVQLIS